MLNKQILLNLSIVIISLVITGHQLQAQNTPQPGNQVGAGTATLNTRPGPYLSTAPINLTRTWVAQKPYTTVLALFTDDGSVSKVQHTTAYSDGLGRSIQSVNWQTSPTGTDQVVPTTYDGFGREQFQYLPYTSPTTDGNVKTDPFGEQYAFYSATYLSEQPTYQHESFYYSHTNFEPTALNRVTSTFAPGNSWAGSEGGTAPRSKNIQYLVNTGSTADNVTEWSITFSALTYTNEDQTTNIPAVSQIYPAGSLMKTVTTDEAGKATVEYSDISGHTVLKKVQIDGTIAADFSGYTGFLCTYYVYDDLGLLRFTITPKAVAQMVTNNSFVLTADMVNELCFRYEYDARQRLIAKRDPGAGWTYMLYDQIDRVVFTQDANLRNSNEWEENLYDNLNRTIETGILTYTGVPTGITINNTQTTTTVTGSTTPTVQANLYINNRQITSPPLTSYTASQSITFDNGFTSEIGAVFTAQIVTTDAQTFSNTLITTANPIPTGCSGCTFVPLTITNYDTYTTGKSFVNYSSNLDQGTNAYADPAATAKTALTYGMVTSSKIRVIENPAILTQGSWLETAVYYDDKGRAIQVQQDNYKGGVDIKTSLYSFTSQVLCTYELHNNASGNIAGFGIKTNMNYDVAGRLLNITKKLSGSIVPSSLTAQRTIATYIYDALGQLKGKQTGLNSTGGPLENDVYNYNIHGQLKGVNWNYSASPTSTNANWQNNKWFAMDLSYDWGFATNQYNGNVAGQRWMNAGDGNQRAYGYGYDGADRFLSADFRQNFNGSWLTTDPSSTNTPLTIDYSVKMGDGSTATSAYDPNGNIKQMQQSGLVLNASPPIDNLTYNYVKVLNGTESSSTGYTETNKLAFITDAATQPSVNLGDFSKLHTTGGDDYGYDKAGNQLTDLNRRINGTAGYNQSSTTGTLYNYLGLPYTISLYDASGNPSQTVTYIYDAGGKKLEKRLVSTTTGQQTITSYLGNFIYENNVLQFFGSEQGRVRFTNDTTTPLVYDYFIQDHIANTRVVLTEEQRTDTYPIATLEQATLTNEENYYSNLTTARVAATSVANYPPPTTNIYTQQLLATGGTAAVGAGVVLKVMAGDMVNVRVDCWYRTNGVALSPIASPGLGNIISLLAGGMPGASAGKFASSELTNTALTPDVTSFLNYRNTSGVTTAPKAYLNVVLLDEQLRPVLTSDGNNSYFQQVPAESGFNNGSATNNTLPIIIANRPMAKSGYLYVYVSNEDQNINVYFDNLQVVHTRGPLLETDDYYPAGLKMAGICSKAVPMMENKFQYQGKYSEFQDETSYDQFELRNYDPQIGRWTSIDPYSQFANPYAGMGDNWPNGIDPTGGLFLVDDALVAGVGFAMNFLEYSSLNRGKKFNFGNAVESGFEGAGIAELGYFLAGGLSAGGDNSATAVGALAEPYAMSYAATSAFNFVQNYTQLSDEKSQGGQIGLLAGYSASSAITAGFNSSFMQNKIDGLIKDNFFIKPNNLFSGAFSQGIGGALSNSINNILQNGGGVFSKDVGFSFFSGFTSSYAGQVAHNAVSSLFPKGTGKDGSYSYYSPISILKNFSANVASGFTQQLIGNWENENGWKYGYDNVGNPKPGDFIFSGNYWWAGYMNGLGGFQSDMYNDAHPN